MEREHREQVELLADTPIDFLLLETFNSIREIVVAAEIAAATEKPFAVSFTAKANGDILNGDTWEKAVKQLSPYNPMAILVNCVPEKVATKALEKIKRSTTLPFGAYANGSGEADSENGWRFTDADRISEYLHTCMRWLELGATIIGGCCGTNPEYTRAYSTKTLRC